MSAVWSGEDTELGRPVAVKLLARDADPARFEREARAVGALAHPNVVRVFDFGESEEGAFMVLELLAGGSLEDRLEPGRPLPDAESERIALALAAGLAHAHAAGLVHRDLKPANVLFDDEDRPKIADFGIARVAGSGTLTETGTVLGTAATISPEQAAGETATPASDVYSFGVILYRMLAGRFPFESADALALAAMHVRETPPPLTELRPDAPVLLESVATACLAKSPSERPPDGVALFQELGGGDGTTRVLPAAAAGVRRRVPARALVLAAVAVAVAAGGAGVAFIAARSTEEPPPPGPAGPAPSRPATTTGAETEAPPPTTAEETTTTQETTAPPTTATEPPPTTLPPTDVPTTILTDTLPETESLPEVTTVEELP